ADNLIVIDEGASNVTIRRCNMHHANADCIRANASNTLVEECYIHHLGMGENSHADGVQTRKPAGNVIFRKCNFDMPSPKKNGEPRKGADPKYKSNACFFIENKV